MLDNWWESAWHWAGGQDNDQEWGHMMIQPIVKWRWAPWQPSSESSLGPAAEAWGLTLSPDHPTSQVLDQVNVFVNSGQHICQLKSTYLSTQVNIFSNSSQRICQLKSTNLSTQVIIFVNSSQHICQLKSTYLSSQVNVFVNSSQPRKREKSLLILKTMYIA